jgi:hypothetical protein
MHEIHVSVVSPEEASYGVAEFWSEGQLIAFTHLDDGDLMLRIEPRRDGAAVNVGAHGLAAALAEASRLLTSWAECGRRPAPQQTDWGPKTAFARM